MLPANLPSDLPSFNRRFGSDDACRSYVYQLRWPTGFVCEKCAGRRCYAHKKRLIYECAACRKQHSLLAGTIFEQTKTGLSKWFLAIYLNTSSKGGIAATELKRHLGFGSDQTPLIWLHKIRAAMVVADRQPLSGAVEADETYVGAAVPGKRGRGAGGKVIIAAAVETRSRVVPPRPVGKPLHGIAKKLADGVRARAELSGPAVRRCLGRIRLGIVPDVSGKSLTEFLATAVAAPAVVTTDGWRGYFKLATTEFDHRALNLSKLVGDAHEHLPATHLVFALFKRWIRGTHHDGVSPKHLHRYLDEYVFRFNRRTATSISHRFHRLLESAIRTPPCTYLDVVGKKPPS